MKTFLATALSCSMLCVVVASPLRAAESEFDVKTTTPIAENAAICRITLRNIQPSLMKAWLLRDPQFPPRIPFPATNFGADFAEVPAGVQNIEADDSTNELRFLAKNDDALSMRDIVTKLDRPIPQVEVSMKLIRLSRSAAKSFFPTTSDKNGVQNKSSGTVFTARNSVEQLDKLIADGTARVVIAPRVTTFDNMKAMSANVRRGELYESRSKDGKLLGYLPVIWQQKFEVIPTLNRDGTINLSAQIFLGYFSDDSKSKNSALLQRLPKGVKPLTTLNSQQISTSAQIKDGDTLLIGALQTDELENEKLVKSEYVVFLSARQIHRVDDPISSDATSSTR